MKKRKEIELDFEIDKLTNSILVNLKKIDDHDFVFVNKPLTAKEEEEFSNFLKARKSKVKEKKSCER